jgi:hypothetical protein
MGSLSLAASCFGQSQPVVASAANNSGCPVMVTAKYVPGATVRPVVPGGGNARQPLHVTFGTLVKEPRYGLNFPGPAIEVREARISVRGISEKGGVIPAGVAAGSPSPWLEKTFTVDVAANAAGVLSATIWLSGYGAVSDVRVDSMTYADGKTWKASEQETCHASTGTILRSSN